MYSVAEGLGQLFLTLSPFKPPEKAKYRPLPFFALSESGSGGGGGRGGGGGAVTLQTPPA